MAPTARLKHVSKKMQYRSTGSVNVENVLFVMTESVHPSAPETPLFPLTLYLLRWVADKFRINMKQRIFDPSYSLLQCGAVRIRTEPLECNRQMDWFLQCFTTARMHQCTEKNLMLSIVAVVTEYGRASACMNSKSLTALHVADFTRQAQLRRSRALAILLRLPMGKICTSRNIR